MSTNRKRPALVVVDETPAHVVKVRRADRRERTKGPHGSLMEVDWKEKWVHVQIKGQGCGAVGVEHLMRLHDVLYAKFGAAYAVKRDDLAWDDFEKSITPAQFR